MGELMSEYTMQAWCVVYTAVDADGKTQAHEDGTPVLYLHPHEEVDCTSDDEPHEDFEKIHGLRYAFKDE
jgi:hypothetical protein